MSDTPDRLETIKNYCDFAIKLERQVEFWEKLTSEAAKKMRELRKRHAQLDKMIKEAQIVLNSLGMLSRQEVEIKMAAIKKHAKYCRVSASCFFLLLIGILVFFFIQMGGVSGKEHGMFLLISLFLGGVAFTGGPLLICIIVFAINKSKQKKLKYEIECVPLRNEERRKKAIFSERLNKAEEERKEICSRENILAEQQKDLKKAQDVAYKHRQEFYEKGEIPKVYQNLEAMISFFYYLDNKVVDEIEGVNGIYNKYHEDCKHMEHMNKLDAIHGAIQEHEMHEQMRHEELMRTLNYYGSAITAQLTGIKYYQKEGNKIAEASYRAAQEFRRECKILNF